MRQLGWLERTPLGGFAATERIPDLYPGQQSLFPDADGTQLGNGRRRALILPKLLSGAARDVRLQTDAQEEAHQILLRWAELETNGKLLKRKETSLHGEFLADIFGKALGYTFFSENLPQWQIEP